MRKLLFVLSIGLLSLFIACGDKSPIQTAVDEYRAGTISEDSLMAFVYDSIRVKETFDWAMRHHQKDDIAAWLLGRAYKFGLGVDRDLIKAKAYYIYACKNGNRAAMSGLGHIYMSYPGCKNLDSAYYWYNEAITHGDADSYFHISYVDIQRKVQNGLPIDTINILEYWQKGVEHNSPACITLMASVYYNGDFSINPDKNKAYNLLSLIPKDKLNAISNYILGKMYELGEGANQNFNTALSFYKKSSEQGNTNATCKLGNFYEWGQGVEKNDYIAFIHYNKVANAGNPWGQRCVALCYYSGTGTERNIGMAEHWMKNAAKGGDDVAIKYCQDHNISYK